MVHLPVKPWGPPVGVMLLAFLVYANVMHAPFYLDDRHVIKENRAIRSVAALLGSSESGTIGQVPPALTKTRFIGVLSFALNYALHGLNTAGYHLVNIAIHAANSLMVYGLVLLLFRTPLMAGAGRGGGLALMAAMAFAVHPLQTQAVTYLTQRFASLAVFFCLGSILSYGLARMVARKFIRAILYATAITCSLCAMLTKEISFSMPLIIVCFEVLFFRESAKRMLLLLAPVLLTMMVIPALTIGTSPGQLDMAKLESATNAAAARIARADYALTQPRVIVTYLRLFVLPFNQNLDYDYPLAQDPLGFRTLLPLALVPFLLGLALFLSLRSERVSQSVRHVFLLVPFGISWFFLALSVESSLIPIDDLIFEHRMYFPMPGLLLAAFSPLLLFRRQSHVRLLAGAAALWIMLLAFTTFSRNALWADPVAFAQDVVVKSPNKARPHVNLGYAYEEAGLLAEAAAAYETGLRLKPGDALARYNLGNVYFKQSRYENAAREYQQAVALDPDFVDAHNNLGNTYRQLGRYEDAAREFRTALIFDPGFSRARFNLDAVEQILSDSSGREPQR